MARKTINVKDIIFVRPKVYRGMGTILEIENDKLNIRIHLAPDEIGFLALKLWEIIDKQQEQLEETKRTMKRSNQ